MLSRFRIIVGRRCRSMRLVIHAYPLAPLGEMTRPQQQEAAHHRKEMYEHIYRQQYHETAGHHAKATQGIRLDQAHRADDLHNKKELLAAAYHSGNEASKHYEAAQYHNAQVTHHSQLAYGRRR